jgi:hypothetical protein
MTKIKNGVAKQIRKKRRRTDIAEWFAELDRLRGDQLFPEGRNQPILRGSIDAEKKTFFKLADQLYATSDPAKRKRIKDKLARLIFDKK